MFIFNSMSPNEEIVNRVADAVQHKVTKVYCGKCKYRIIRATDRCKKILIPEDNYLEPTTRLGKCIYLNCDNDCKEYKREPWWRIPLW